VQLGPPTNALARFLSDKIQPFIRQTPSFLKNFTEFIHLIHDPQLNEQDPLVSFDVVSLFTKILIPQDLNIISNLVNLEPLNLIKICFTYTFFSFKGKFYEQTEGTAPGSSLSPIVANNFMEHFEILALNSCSLKPKC
jgi:hypothetical protein